MKRTPKLNPARRFRRTTWVLPLCLSLVMIPGYLSLNLTTTTPLTVQKVIDEWTVIRWVWLIDLSVTYIPFMLIGWIGGFSIYMSERNIYAANGALYGISIITTIFWFLIGFVSAIAPLDPAGYMQVNFAYLLVFAPITGIASVLIGALIGFIYGKYRHRGNNGPRKIRRTTKP